MKRRIGFQDAFVAGVEIKITLLGWGAQKRIAGTAGISPSYLNDILKTRKRATEETRRKIARALNLTYEEIMAMGRNRGNGALEPSIEPCRIYEKFSEEKAVCIYRYAAKKMGIRESYFFTADCLKRARPPGWLDYLGREIDETTLHEIAAIELKKLKEQIIRKEMLLRNSALKDSLSGNLKSNFEDVFPETAQIIKKSRKNNELRQFLFGTVGLRDKMEKVGIDMFLGQHYFEYNLRGGASGVLKITTQENKRFLENALNRNGSTPFAVFHSEAWCILLNLDHLVFGQILFESERAPESNAEDAYAVEIFFADNADPKIIPVEEDELDLADLKSPGQIGSIISLAKIVVEQGNFFRLNTKTANEPFFQPTMSQ